MNAARRARFALLAAVAALVGASALLAVAAVRSTGHADAAAPALHATAALQQDTAERPGDAIDISRLLARDPFSLVRSAPEVPYRIGEVATIVRPDAPRSRPVMLLGTIVRSTGRSFAMCQVPGGPAQVVYPGQVIGGLTLESVAQGSATFTDESGARVTLRVTRTGE